jgi:hypothetical protein
VLHRVLKAAITEEQFHNQLTLPGIIAEKISWTFSAMIAAFNTIWNTKDWLIDWLYDILRPAQQYFTYIETLPLAVKGCKILAYAGRSGPLSGKWSLSCHTYCDTGPRFFRSYPTDCPHSVVSYDTQGDVENLF